MYIPNIASTIKEMTVNELRDFVFEKYYKKFARENSYYSMTHQKKKNEIELKENIPDPCNAKKHQSILRKKNKISKKKSKNIQNFIQGYKAG